MKSALKQPKSVTHGSQIGPLLFITYAIDLPQKVEQCESFGYADDNNILTTDLTNLQVDINKIENDAKTR